MKSFELIEHLQKYPDAEVRVMVGDNPDSDAARVVGVVRVAEDGAVVLQCDLELRDAREVLALESELVQLEEEIGKLELELESQDD